MNKSTISTKLGEWANYIVCILLLPFVLMGYQYQRNIQYLSLYQILVFSILLSGILVAFYFISKIFISSDLGAFLFTSILFLSFFMYRELLPFYRKAVSMLRISDSGLSTLANATEFFALFIIAGMVVFHIRKVGGRLGNVVKKSPVLTLKIAIGVADFKSIQKINIPFTATLFSIFLYLVFKYMYSFFFSLFNIDKLGQSFFSSAIIFALILVYLCWVFKSKLESKVTASVAFVIMFVMLIQNVGGIAWFAFQQQKNNIFYKETFTVNIHLEEQPNIYWFHCDGMLGFDAMERFFGDKQDKFAQELETRGFWINREAAFDAAHSTSWAIPTLMSPYYYDRVLSWRFDPLYAEDPPKNKDLLNNPRSRLTPNPTSNRIAREINETVMAFNAAGYNTSTVANIDVYFYPTVRQFYNHGSLMTTTQTMTETMEYVNNVSNLRNLFDLLSMISPIPDSESSMKIRTLFRKLNAIGFTSVDVEDKVDLFADLTVDNNSIAAINSLNSYDRIADSLYDILERPSPKFTVVAFDMPHRPFYYNEQGLYNIEDSNNPMRYPAHHTFSISTLFKYLDIIMESDPDAVIILQADHGLHGLKAEEIINAFNCTDEEALAMWNQIMSAVRLPKEKMTPETLQILSDPRNISRYLINTFVGTNYDYIPTQFKQVFTGPEY